MAQDTVRKRKRTIAVNIAWGIYFALWAGAHIRLLYTLEGAQRAVEFLLIIQNLMLMFFFIVRNPPKVTSWNLLDVMWAMLGGFGMTLCWSSNQYPAYSIGILLQMIGAFLTLYASASLGRSWGVIPANRSIQTKGMYRFIRHPIYASWQIFFIGYLINQPSRYNIAIGIICFLSQIMRIFSEEKLLVRDPDYAAYRARVKWRMIPFIF